MFLSVCVFIHDTRSRDVIAARTRWLFRSDLCAYIVNVCATAHVCVYARPRLYLHFKTYTYIVTVRMYYIFYIRLHNIHTCSRITYYIRYSYGRETVCIIPDYGISAYALRLIYCDNNYSPNVEKLPTNLTASVRFSTPRGQRGGRRIKNLRWLKNGAVRHFRTYCAYRSTTFVDPVIQNKNV